MRPRHGRGIAGASAGASASPAVQAAGPRGEHVPALGVSPERRRDQKAEADGGGAARGHDRRPDLRRAGRLRLGQLGAPGDVLRPVRHLSGCRGRFAPVARRLEAPVQPDGARAGDRPDGNLGARRGHARRHDEARASGVRQALPRHDPGRRGPRWHPRNLAAPVEALRGPPADDPPGPIGLDLSDDRPDARVGGRLAPDDLHPADVRLDAGRPRQGGQGRIAVPEPGLDGLERVHAVAGLVAGSPGCRRDDRRGAPGGTRPSGARKSSTA